MMPDLPVGSLLPSSEQQGIIWKKWLQYLGGGGLALLIAVIGLGLSVSLYNKLMQERAEDRTYYREQDERNRVQDKEYRDQLLTQTERQSELQAQSLEVHRATKEVIEDTKETLEDLGGRIDGLKDEINTLGNVEQQTHARLDRLLEKAWNIPKQIQPQPTPQN
jgi:uncharacterized protein HemX